MSKWLAMLLLIPSLAWGGASRDFPQDVANYLDVGTAIITATPLTFACWHVLDSSHVGILVSVCDTASANHWFQASNTTFLDRASMTTQGGGSSQGTISADSWVVGTWYHNVGISESGTSRFSYKDGVPGAESTGSATPSGLDTSALGIRCASTYVEPLDGKLHQCGIWNVVLSDPEIDELAAGQWITWIHNDALVSAYTLMNDVTTEVDLIGGINMTETGSVTESTDGPPTWFPMGSQ